ncbi:glycosyltransferase family 8 protein [Mycena maculata]|uniref:Glycosyltransferase family 8 protein n=1 Tax=Mycena maculata TaxID=230809 RepID=A0AAD7JP96_9AGAR|nr:glycosyltransferase family 8 protein [Mycena maculata]
MYPLFERVHDRWTYEPLQELGQTPSGCRKWSQSWVWRSLVGALGVAAVFAITRAIYHKRRYSPLDQYQDLNQFPVTLDHAPDHSPVDRRAVVSSLYSDGFAIAVAVVGHSARSANVSARFLVPYLENKVSEKALCIVRAVGWEPYPVPWIPPPHDGNGIHLRFMDQYTKLNVWALDKMGIDSAVYLDADTLVRRNFDELFDSPFNFAAVPDVDVHGGGFILSFNAGVLAFRPSSAVLKDMLQKLEVAEYPPEEAEQAFLNRYFAGTCMRLPFIYNANLGYKGRSPRLWKRLIDEMRIVHYTAVKPFIQDIHVTDTVLPAEEIEDAMEKSVLKKGGLYREEVGWWKDAYRKMMLDRGDAINQCL